MQIIDETAVDMAAEHIASGGPRAWQRARALGQLRPELVAYVVAATRQLSVSSQASAWRGLELCCEAMGAMRTGGRASVERVLEMHSRNLRLSVSVGMAHPKLADRWLSHSGALHQRTLLRHLFEETAGTVEKAERATVFLILKTVVDVLDEGADEHAPI